MVSPIIVCFFSRFGEPFFSSKSAIDPSKELIAIMIIPLINIF